MCCSLSFTSLKSSEPVGTTSVLWSRVTSWCRWRSRAMPEAKKVRTLDGDPAKQEMRRLTRRSLITGGVAALAGLGGWGWLTTAGLEDGLPWPLRRMLGFNQRLG